MCAPDAIAIHTIDADKYILYTLIFEHFTCWISQEITNIIRIHPFWNKGYLYKIS